jgi:hypothetical protein
MRVEPGYFRARFHSFHPSPPASYIKEGGRPVAVDAGLDLPGPRATQKAAVQAAREILADHVRTGADLHVEAVIVTDQFGHLVMALPITSVLPRTPATTLTAARVVIQ